MGDETPEANEDAAVSDATLPKVGLLSSTPHPAPADHKLKASATESRKASALKSRFRGSATTGRSLDVQDLQEVLEQGRPDISEEDVQALFGLMKQDADGRIEFDELVDFL